MLTEVLIVSSNRSIDGNEQPESLIKRRVVDQVDVDAPERAPVVLESR